MLDLTRLLPGAWATQVLADFGAEIIKIEEPPLGESGRRLPPMRGNESELFLLTNRGKKSVCINLKDPRGKQVFLRLASSADILIESFRPRVMDRLGLGYAELCRHNMRLIYAAISGYGQSSPNASLPGHDINFLALSGLLDLMRDSNGSPIIPPIQAADLMGGALQAIVGILLGLVCRSVTGRGQMIDVAMLDGLLPLLMVPRVIQESEQRQALGVGLLTGSYACYHVYLTRDGNWISVGALEPKFWHAICEALRCKEFSKDQFAGQSRQVEMITDLSRRFLQKDARDWIALLKHACVTPVEKLSAAEPGIMPALSMTPGQRGGNVPRVGENTKEILTIAGLSSIEIDELQRDQVVLCQ